jgi:large subunit ribosomal protein L22
MGMVDYSMVCDPDVSARAIAYELHVSPKHAVEICREIRGKDAPEAKDYLEDVVNLRKPVPFKRYKRKVGHRSGIKGWDAGRYPKKAASEILRLIESAEKNAEYKGLDPEELMIAHIAAHRGRKIRGIMPRAFGRATAKDTETATIEVILMLTDFRIGRQKRWR